MCQQGNVEKHCWNTSGNLKIWDGCSIECPSSMSKTLSATGDWKNQRAIYCKEPQEAWVRKVNEPTFSIIPVGVFM